MKRPSGFGFESNNDTSGTQLLTIRYTDLMILPNSECKNGLVTGQMCADPYFPGIGPCRDEGSALYVTQATGGATVVAIFSYGYAEGSCPESQPLFTRVSNYVDWINQEITNFVSDQ